MADHRCPNCAPGYDCESGIYTPAPVNEVDDSLSDDGFTVYAPCQPIGCDNGFHIPGCVYEEADRA